MFHDAFVDPITSVNGDVIVTLYGQAGFKSGSTNGAPNVGTTTQLEECRNPSLGLATKARGCKVASQEKNSEVMSHALGSVKSVRE
jgi:hypothetical protein